MVLVNFLRKEIEVGYFSKRVLFKDEAYFTRESVFNTHNLNMWQNYNPLAVHQSHQSDHQYRFSVNLWAGIVDNYLVESYLMLWSLTTVRKYMDNTFPNRWIWRDVAVSWPAKSPDMIPLDFHLCSFSIFRKIKSFWIFVICEKVHIATFSTF